MSEGLTFSGPYPEVQTAGSSTAAVPTLLNDLMDDLEVSLELSTSSGLLAAASTLSSDLGAALAPVVKSVLTSLPLDDIFTSLLDPLLKLLGIGIAEADVSVLDIVVP